MREMQPAIVDVARRGHQREGPRCALASTDHAVRAGPGPSFPLPRTTRDFAVSGYEQELRSTQKENAS